MGNAVFDDGLPPQELLAQLKHGPAKHLKQQVYRSAPRHATRAPRVRATRRRARADTCTARALVRIKRHDRSRSRDLVRLGSINISFACSYARLTRTM